jgi:heat shock protein HtpX
VTTIKTILLLGGLTALLVAIGANIQHGAYLPFFFAFAIVMNFVTYFWSDKIVLRMNHARPLPESEAPWLYDMVRELTGNAGIPMPPIYLIDEPQPNAFATGRNPNHAAIAVTSGILRMLERRELRGVLAHEISHVKNRDILIATIAAMLATTISYAANALKWGMIFGGLGGRDREDRGGNALGELAMIILAPIIALLIQMAISRQREFQADESGAKISHDPDALANALERIDYSTQRIPNQTAAPATASLYIMNPLHGGFGAGLARLFSTHPATAERVRRLRQMMFSQQAY